ncbi:uncharacterized protein LOC143517469 isoform X2 [Brachyhypopomus gauderio]|uniref:uncharacterized protein LOC143517469 isoform X2 n=1 Tax=Brachyhypopomus gauderio TaxID=698409 RepID=UPI004041E4E4
MAKSAFQAQLSSIMGIMTESAMKQICEIVDHDFAYLRLELTRALNENAALSDKMHALEGEVETLRNTKNEPRTRSKKCRSVCIQTVEVSDSPSINGIFGKEWCSSLWEGSEPRTGEKPNDNSNLLTIKEENCEKEVCPANSNEAVVTRRKNPSSPSNHNGIPEVNLDDDDDEEEDVYFISAGFVETPEVHPTPSISPGADYPKIICVDDTVENLIMPSYNPMEFDEHCMPIEFIAGEHTARHPFEEQEKVTPHDPVKDAGIGLGGGQILRYFDGFSVHEHLQSEETLKAMPRCSECSREFSRQSSLTLHRKKCHQKLNLYTCPKCKEVFHQKNLLRTHKCLPSENPAKTSSQRFRCEECGKHFHSRANLRVHNAVHTGEKPYRCSYCGRGFSQKGNRTAHERIHKGERPFVCLTCGKSFIQKVNLKQHLVVHSRIQKSKAKKNTEKPL